MGIWKKTGRWPSTRVPGQPAAAWVREGWKVTTTVSGKPSTGAAAWLGSSTASRAGS